MEPKLETEMLDVHADGGIATVTLHNRPDITKDVGADCARRMAEFILGHVFVVDSTYRGLMLDVRHGPPVFGPQTRKSLGELLSRAVGLGIRLAVVVGEAAIQRLQFTSMCREYAPGISVITRELEVAYAWMGTATTPSPA